MKTDQRHSSDLRTLGPWLLAEFLASFASMVFVTGCYDWALGPLKTSPSGRLWMSAAWGFVYIFVSLLAGRVVEKWGPRRAVITVSCLTVFTALLGLTVMALPVAWMVLLVMLPYNLTSSLTWPAIESGLTRSPGKMSLSARIAVYNLSWSGGAFASMTHGYLEEWSFSLVFIVPAVLSALAAFCLWKWGVPADKIAAQNVPDEAEGEHELDDPAVRRRAQLLLKMAWISNPLAYVAIYVVLPIMTQLAQQAGIVTLGAAAFVGSIWFIARFVGFGITWKWIGWHYKMIWQIGPLTAIALSLAGMLMIHSLLALVFLQIVFGLSAALLYSASLYYAMHVSSGHGGHAAFHEAALGIGTMAGPMIGALSATGELDEHAMKRIALAVGSILILGGIVMIALWLRGSTAKTTDAQPIPDP